MASLTAIITHCNKVKNLKISLQHISVVESQEATLALTAVSDGASLRSFTISATNSFNGLYYLNTIDNGTEDAVLTIQMRGGDSGHEELRSVGVGTSISHRKKVWAIVAKDKVLIRELTTID